MDNPNGVLDLIQYQSVFSAILVSLKKKGYNDEQIGLLLGEDPRSVTVELMQYIDSYLGILVKQTKLELDPVDENWMVEIANRAVSENLVNDQPKHGTAQGYACAMSALKLATAYRGTDLKAEPETVVPEVDSRKELIASRARELYHATNAKYGPESAARQAFDYIAEQNGIATIEGMGLSDDELRDLRARVIAILFGTDASKKSPSVTVDYKEQILQEALHRYNNLRPRTVVGEDSAREAAELFIYKDEHKLSRTERDDMWKAAQAQFRESGEL